MNQHSKKQMDPMPVNFRKIVITLGLIIMCVVLSRAQNLYIRSTGETGPTSGTNWSISGGTLTVSGGNASINASVVINYLQNNGNLTLFAPGGIYIRQIINPTLSASRSLIFKANGFVFNENTVTCSGNALNVVLWSDADGNNDGRIILYEASQIETNNGHVWLGGGSGSSYWNGLTVGNSAAVAASANIYGINVQGATINAGTGDVYMNGRSYGTTGDYRFGVRIADYGDVNFSTVICQNLDITGVASAGTGSYSYHDGVNINTFTTLTLSGNLNITGTGGGGNSTGSGNYGISIDSSTITLTGSGQVTLLGYGGSGSGGYNYGVSFSNKTSVVVNSGNVDITAVNGTATTIGFRMKNTSVLKSGASGTGSGNITIIADDIDFTDAASQISSSGSITIRPNSNNSTIGIGSGTGGTMELLGTYFTNNISSNFSTITIGGSNSGSIAIKEAYFRSPVIFQGASGTQLQPTTNVNITGKSLTLGDNITLNESNGVLYGTSGTITATRMLVNPTSVNVAGLGAVITSSYTLGTTVITRGHTAQSGLVNGASGIARYYDISPYSNSGLNATFVFKYSAMDVNSLNEDAFGLFKSTNGGSTYTRQNGTPDASGNTVTLSGVGSFSRWTVGESCLNPATAGVISSNQTICYNGSTSDITGTAPGTYFGDLEYSWQKSTLSDAAGFSFIPGATSSSYNPGTLTQTTYFKRLAKVTCAGSWPESGTSNVVTVTVRPQFSAGTISSTGETICYNTSPAQAIGNVTAGSGGDGTITYSWRSSADSYASAITGATSATYTPAGPLTTTTSFRRYVKDGTCNTTPTVSSGTWTVTVRSLFSSGAIASTGETICYNTSPATAIGNTTPGSGGDGTITYSWRSSADSYTTAISGATSSTYIPAGPLTTTTSYQRYVKDGTCNTTPTLSTGNWTVTVRPQFSAGTIASTGETINYNNNPTQAIGNDAAGSGGDGVIAYSWRSSGDSYATAIAGATNATYTPAGPLTSATSYRRYVKDGTCNTTPTASTGTWTVTVLTPAVTTTAITAVTIDSATSGGENIEDLNATITEKGIVWSTSSSPTTSLSTKTSEPVVAGSEDAGFSSYLSGLFANSKYYTRAYIVNSYGTFYGNEHEFYTRAKIPAMPVVNNPQLTSLDVAVNANGNPAITNYAIRVVKETTAKYVHSTGILVDTAVWQTQALWGTKTVTGLTTGATYTFSVKAKNESGDTTAFGPTDNGIPYGIPSVSSMMTDSITTSSAKMHGRITSVNGNTVTNRGMIWYPFSDSAKIIGGYQVTNIYENGSFDTSNYSAQVSGLSVNAHYSFRAHATNAKGTGYGSKNDFWTLANLPAAPGIGNPQTTSLDLSIHANGNPAITTYAIAVSWGATTKYVNTSGLLVNVPSWQTETQWEVDGGNQAKRVFGLLVNTKYHCSIKARNGENVMTDQGPSDSLYTLAAVPGLPLISGRTNQSANVSVFDTVNPAITEFAVFETGTGSYIQADGSLGASAVFRTRTLWHTAAGNTAVTVTGLLPDSLYAFCVKGRNGDLIQTAFGDTAEVRTLPNVPSPPVVINPTATSLDVSVVINGNPSHTRYAIQDSANSLYVQANGTRTATPVWQTATAWDTLTVTGLETGIMYYFRIMAKNLDGDSTVFGLATGRNTCSNPTDGGTISASQEICYGSTPAALVNVSDASNYGGIMEYQWQLSTTSDSTGFSDIAGADTAGYATGALTDTTWYRRLSRVTCKPDWSDATSSNVVKITVDPTTVGGSVSGDTLVCYGSHSSVLTLSGQTGGVNKWQYSTDGTNWIDISSHTATTYTAEDLIVDTWYRAVVQSGVCLVENSASHKIRVFKNYKISGYAKYNNNPKTPLNGLKVVLHQDNGSNWVKIDSAVTNNAGFYEFDSLTNNTYSLQIKSAHPSGQWQTWGGVTNSDYLLVSQHVAGSNLLQVDPPVVRVSASVKAPHPLINTNDATTIRQAAKYPTTGFSYFDIPKWVFSGLDQTTRIDSVELSCADVTRDIRGLCAGDVNGTFVPPSGNKSAVETHGSASISMETHGSASISMETHGSASLQLVQQGAIRVTDEMTFAVRLVETQGSPQPIGAITLFMNYDPTLVEITNVTMPMNAGTEPWFETNNGVLYIGWISTEPISVVENQTVLLVHARLVTKSTPIRFTLNETMVSELADGDGNVIDGAKLAMPGAGSNGETAIWENGETGKWQNGETVKWQNGNIVCYPNPVQSTLNIELFTSNLQPSTCNLQLVNFQGLPVLNLPPATFSNGWHKVQLDVRDLMPGAYCLRAWINGEIFVKKVIITR